MKTDIEIARETALRPVAELAAELGIAADGLLPYGKYRAKITPPPRGTKTGKLILVTAVNPTAGGEGKTTVSIGLADAMRRLGAKTVLALRQPSLGPVFGIKGGATGGGFAQVAPMDDINLHFTGDFHAITAANNLLCALLDNHIHWGNAWDIDPERIVFKRCQDVNDRALREIEAGRGGAKNGVPRADGFDITAACEVMAVLCLADNLADLKRRLRRIIVAYDRTGNPITAADLKAGDAMAILLRDALNPNLVQTLEHTPALIHGGPFANIAHGCNSVTATRAALCLGDYAVTEAGFGADLGAEKFIDIKCRAAGLNIACVVLVATVRALKLHGGADKDSLKREDLGALTAGLPNLIKHIRNITTVFRQPCVVALNRFESDTAAELDVVRRACADAGVQCFDAEYFMRGGEGGLELAARVRELADGPTHPMTYAYELDEGCREKIEHIARKVYGADGVDFTPAAEEDIGRIVRTGMGGLPVCIAKTQYSLSDNPARLGAPSGFRLTVRRVIARAGAGFLAAIAGDMLLMPGLSRSPNAERMTITDNGVIFGLF
jgi:formate--tetrahydrofolate ligase